MSERITQAKLDNLLEHLNNITDGEFNLGYAYGGVMLERKNGSVDISPRGTKRETYYWIHSFIDGFSFAQRKYVMQVRNSNGSWSDVSPTGTYEPYKFDTREAAMKRLNRRYPDQVYGEEVRVSK